MAAIPFQVSCINKQDRQNAHERIISIGGTITMSDGNLVRWKQSQEQAIEDIEKGVYSYWVSVGDKSVWIVVGESRYGNKYLKTEDDDESQNNLLSLPECPA